MFNKFLSQKSGRASNMQHADQTTGAESAPAAGKSLKKFLSSVAIEPHELDNTSPKRITPAGFYSSSTGFRGTKSRDGQRMSVYSGSKDASTQWLGQSFDARKMFADKKLTQPNLMIKSTDPSVGSIHMA